ncbi:hypothetical protein [Streptomyces brasiliscabiei]|uniref:hypothetical protein n=1 Tax=Streptomyces brasiliscabiei TaxID=2736302 RepID=UPI001C10260C|nr:hypothetical protein [Streptomyces brasiliscabiei]
MEQGELSQDTLDVLALWRNASRGTTAKKSSPLEQSMFGFVEDDVRRYPAHELVLWLDAQRLMAGYRREELAEVIGVNVRTVVVNLNAKPQAGLMPAQFCHAVARACGAETEWVEVYQRVWANVEAARAAARAAITPVPLRFTRKPVPPPEAQGDAHEAVVWLDEERRRSKVKLETLAAVTGVNKSTVSRNLNPARPRKTLMAEDFFMTVASACGADMEVAAEVYRLASGEALAHVVAAKPVYFAQNFAELVQAMIQLRRNTGNLSLVKLEKAALPAKLPHTTLARVLSGHAVPTKDLMLAFVAASDPDNRLSQPSDWGTAWDNCRLEQLLTEVRRLPSAKFVAGMVTFPDPAEMDAEELENLRTLIAAMELYTDPRYPPPLLFAPIAV